MQIIIHQGPGVPEFGTAAKRTVEEPGSKSKSGSFYWYTTDLTVGKGSRDSTVLDQFKAGVFSARDSAMEARCRGAQTSVN
jgi:hypothetical protein